MRKQPEEDLTSSLAHLCSRHIDERQSRFELFTLMSAPLKSTESAELIHGTDNTGCPPKEVLTSFDEAYLHSLNSFYVKARRAMRIFVQVVVAKLTSSASWT